MRNSIMKGIKRLLNFECNNIKLRRFHLLDKNFPIYNSAVEKNTAKCGLLKTVILMEYVA